MKPLLKSLRLLLSYVEMFQYNHEPCLDWGGRDQRPTMIAAAAAADETGALIVLCRNAFRQDETEPRCQRLAVAVGGDG